MMTDILIYHGKHGKVYWLVDTPVRLAAAKQALFQQLDEDGCYGDVAADLLAAARVGNAGAIRRVLDDRSGYEYEEWDIESIEVPVVPPQSTKSDLASADLPSVPRRLDLLSFDIYQRAAYVTATYPREKVIDYPTLGLTGEAGETANQVSKIYRDDGSVLTTERKAKIVKELGDTLWFLAAVATDIGVSLTDVAVANLAKLYNRKEHGTIQGDGDDR